MVVPVAFDLVFGPLTLIPEFIRTGHTLSFGTYLQMIGPGPLWFAEVLFVFGCAYVAVRLVRRRQAPPDPATPPTARTVFLFTVALAAVTFAFRMVVPLGYTLPILDLPTPSYLPQYVGLFVVGIVAARRGWFRSVPDWMGWTGLALSAGATLVLFLPALPSRPSRPRPPRARRRPASLWTSRPLPQVRSPGPKRPDQARARPSAQARDAFRWALGSASKG
jgi:glucans biosynthesis protein C